MGSKDKPDFIAGKIAKNDGEEIQVRASSFKGFRNAHIRLHVTRKDGVDLDEPAPTPTHKGVTLRLDQLPALIQHLETLCEAEGIELPATAKAVTS